MVALNRLTCPSACWLYLVVYTVLTLGFLQSATKLGSELGPLSVSTVDSIPKFSTQCSINVLAIIVAAVLATGIALASLEWRFIIMTMYLFPLSILDKRPSMSKRTKTREIAGGYSRNLCLFLLVQQFCVHDMHLGTVL